MAIRKTLQRTSLQAGNWIAIAFLVGTAGFVLGWIMAFNAWASQCFPVV